ncbi:MAG: sulfotransferase family protein [Cyclobacteriaceae bacterium]
MILNLISGPRNVSTALMYSFAQRPDTHVLDEPFYAVYLAKTGVNHPGAQAVLDALPQDEKRVRQHIASRSLKPVLFVKNMAHHMEVLDDPFIADAKNIFLIRDPRQILASYSAVISHPVMRDLGIAYQYELFRLLRQRGVNPIVMDSGYLLKDPVLVLTDLCTVCHLKFEQRMAHWPQGPKPYDGVWAPHWYANVHRSTGFEKQPTRSQPLPAHLNTLYSEARSFYEKLLPFSLKA